jgi:putative phosphoesterase
VTRSRLLPEKFISRIKEDDTLLHLGDITSFEVWEYLSGLCHFEAIYGNCDLPDVRRRLKAMRIIEMGGHRIGMIHGNGGPADSLRKAQYEFAGTADIVLFGHTHISHHSREGDMLLFNPGSMKDGRGEGGSYGILHLDETPWGEILEL